MLTSRHTPRSAGLAIVGALAIASCTSTTTVAGSWRDPSFPGGTLRRPLVVAIANRPVLRLELEDELVYALQRAGVDALASHAIFPERELNVTIVRDRLAQTDRDSMMVTHLVDVKRETVVVPGEAEAYSMVAPYPRYGTWGAYYTSTYGIVSSPGYTYESKRYVLQTNLYSLANQRLVWTVVTESEEPTSLDPAIRNFAEVVVNDLERTGVL